jgi:hypothetical protein
LVAYFASKYSFQRETRIPFAIIKVSTGFYQYTKKSISLGARKDEFNGILGI